MRRVLPARFRLGSSNQYLRLRLVAIVALLAILAPLLLGAGVPRAALAQADGEHILQCSCPVWWSGPWEGEGSFDANASLDTVALENGDATLVMYEIPLRGNGVLDLVDERTAELEGSRRISDLEEVLRIDGDNTAIIGRRWVNRNDDLILSYQYVQVWESNYYLSIEFNAPDDQFVDLWDSLDDVLLVGTPVLGEFVGETVHEKLAGGQGASRRGSGIDADLEAAGVLDEVTYESPNFGYDVAWTDAWTVIPDNTTTADGYDQIQFISEDNWVVSFSGEQLGRRMEVADYVDRFIANEEDTGGEILLDDVGDTEGGYLAIYESDSGAEMVIYAAATLYDEDGTVVLVLLIAPVEDFEDALDEVQADFALDGEPVLELFRTREIQRALDN
jgi:hypothetical protein